MKSKSVFFIGGGLLAFLAILILASLAREEGTKGVPGGSPPAPLFSLKTLSGERIDLADLRGNVVVLDFWATWCPPCREGIPELNRLHRAYRDRGLAVIGISLDRGGPEEVRRFLDQKGAEYVNVMGDEEVFRAYNGLPGLGKTPGIPTAFVIDREGRVRKRFVGLTRMEDFETAVKPLL
jgi:peroxiredoxin